MNDDDHDAMDDEVDETNLPLTRSSVYMPDKGMTKLPDKQKKKRSCWQYIFVRAQTFEDNESKIKATLRELLIYLAFLFVLCFLVFNSASVTMFYYTKIMTDLFVNKATAGGLTFSEIGRAEDFWKFAQGPLLHSLYWDQWYNNKDLKDSNISGYIYYENKLLGLPRIRQLRVITSDCLVSSEFKLYIQACYNEYSFTTQDKAPFGKGVTDPNATAWHFQDADDIDGSWFWGKLTSYGGSGFVQDLPVEKKEAKKILTDLHDNMWIRRGTRVVFVTFSVYNANVNLFSIIRLSVEFPATGGALPSWSINTARLVRRTSPMNIVLIVFEVIFITFIVLFLIEEIVQMKHEGWKYITEFWNFFDVLLILMSIGSIVLFGVSKKMGEMSVESFVSEHQNSYADFVTVGLWHDINLNVQAITSFVGFIKVFKYIGFNKTMIQLSMTLSSCAKDLAGFFIMFFIVFLAFTQLGYLLFGSQLKDFSTFMSSFFTLFRIILGDFNFHQLEQANSVLGPIFFMLFVFFVFFVLINMFLAIINDTYSEIKSDVAKRAEVYIMSDYLKETYYNMLTKLNASHDKVKKLQSFAGSRAGSRRKSSVIKLDEWKAGLYMQGFTDEEIEPIFHKYDKDKNQILDSEEKKLMLEELMEQKKKDKKANQDDQMMDDGKEDEEDEEFLRYPAFLDLSKRIGRMEDAMTKLVFNVEQVLSYMSKK